MSEAVEKVSSRQSFWLLPSIYDIAALLLGAVTLTAGYSLTRDVLLSGLTLVKTDLAIQILSTPANAILTMTTITFSMIMIVLVIYSPQFSLCGYCGISSPIALPACAGDLQQRVCLLDAMLLFVNKNPAFDLSVKQG